MQDSRPSHLVLNGRMESHVIPVHFTLYNLVLLKDFSIHPPNPGAGAHCARIVHPGLLEDFRV
jgi:hypothetical protein